jgi:hypothetical protein
VHPQDIHPLILKRIVQPGDGQPLGDLHRVAAGPAIDIVRQPGRIPPRSARHLVQAQLKLMILQPVRLAQQRIEHRRFFDMGKGDAKMGSQLTVRCAEQKRLHMLRRRRLLKPPHHRALPAVLHSLQNPQRLAPRPIAKQQRRAQQLGAVPPTMHVHRPRDGGLDLGTVLHQCRVRFGQGFRGKG